MMADPAGATRADTYVFDAYGTLFDVHSAVNRHHAEIGDVATQLSNLWRDKQLQYTWIRAMTGRHQPFNIVTAAALDFAIESVGGLRGGMRETLLEAYMTLDAYPEVPQVLAGLKTRGATLAILSNGTPDMLDAAVRSAGLDDVFDAVISIEEIGIYKPDMRVYQMTCDRFDVSPDAVTFQSSNRWDIAGAKAFGYRCYWVNRFAAPDEFPDMAPDAVFPSLSPLLEHQGG
ncbi:MAG: haloacid dehalogenase type II [Pseudomonadota bacterium]